MTKNVLGPYVQVFDSVTIVVQDSQSNRQRSAYRPKELAFVFKRNFAVVRKSIWDQRALAKGLHFARS